MIVIVNTLPPDDDHTYLQNVYTSYYDVSTQATRVNLRVILLLLNKFDRLKAFLAALADAVSHVIGKRIWDLPSAPDKLV
jgi:hypothetical protein